MNERMRKKLEELQRQSQSHGQKGARFPLGISRWRILPYKLDAEGDPVHFYVERVHRVMDQAVICGRSTGSDCPLCDWREANKNSEKELRQAIASAFYPREVHWVNLLPIKENEDGKLITQRKAVATQIPKTVYDAVLENILNGGHSDLLDEQNGNVISIKKHQKSPDPRHVEYTVMVDPSPKPIFKDPKVLAAAKATVENFEKTHEAPSHDALVSILEKAKKDKAFHEKAIQDYIEFKERWEKKGGQRG